MGILDEMLVETASNVSILLEGFFSRSLVLNAASMSALPCFLRSLIGWKTKIREL